MQTTSKPEFIQILNVDKVTLFDFSLCSHEHGSTVTVHTSYAHLSSINVRDNVLKRFTISIVNISKTSNLSSLYDSLPSDTISKATTTIAMQPEYKQ